MSATRSLARSALLEWPGIHHTAMGLAANSWFCIAMSALTVSSASPGERLMSVGHHRSPSRIIDRWLMWFRRFGHEQLRPFHNHLQERVN